MLEFRTTAAPAALILMPPPDWIVMLPADPFAAVAVAAGLLTMLEIVRLSAKAGVATVASKKQTRGLRFTIPIKQNQPVRCFSSGSPEPLIKVPRPSAASKPG